MMTMMMMPERRDGSGGGCVVDIWINVVVVD